VLVSNERMRLGNVNIHVVGNSDSMRRSIYLNRPDNLDYIRNYIRTLYLNTNRAVRIQLYFGYVAGEVNIYRPAEIDFRAYFDTPRYMNNFMNAEKIAESIDEERIIEKGPSEDSGLFLSGVYNVLIMVFRTEFIMGNPKAVSSNEEIRKTITNSESIASLNNIDDGKCLFACLAYKANTLLNRCGICNENYKCEHKDKDDCIVCKLKYSCENCEYKISELIEKNKIKKYSRLIFNDYYNYSENKLKEYNEFKGFNMDELENIERNYKVFINSFIVNDIDKSKLIVERYKRSKYERVPGYKEINVILIEDHICYIRNKELVIGQYQCDICGKLWKDMESLNRHNKSCKDEIKETFPELSRRYEPSGNVIIKLADEYNVNINDIYYDYLATYDYEVIQKDEEKQELDTDNKTIMYNFHEPVSVSVSSNIDGYNVKCFVCVDYGSSTNMTEAMFKHLKEIQTIAYNNMKVKFRTLYDEIYIRMISTEGYEKTKHERNLEKLDDYCRQLPVLGFNSGKYDINVNKSFGFVECCLSDNINFIIKKGKNYMNIKTDSFTFLDALNYTSPTTLDKFVEAYTGIKCKAIFPYEWFDSLSKLDEKEFPPIKAFDSKLKGETCGEEEYEKYKKIYYDNGMKSMREYLEYYNNLDVEPLLKAIIVNKNYYKQFKIDMLKDSFTLASLANKILFHYAKGNIEEYSKRGFEENNNKHIDKAFDYIGNKITNYKRQDKEAKRNITDKYIDESEIKYLLIQNKFRCEYCRKDITSNWTLDRIDNNYAHESRNCVVSCYQCNTSRSNRSYITFKKEKMMECYEIENPQIKVITEENKKAYYLLKKNMNGGPSIVFHRYHEAFKTYISRVEWKNRKWEIKNGNLVRKIVGYDANALYLWCMSQDMPCGELKYIEDDNMNIIEKVKTEDFFGFVEVDIKVSEEKYNYFSEMTPLFKNATIDESELSEYMNNLYKTINGKKKKAKTKKLIGAMSSTKKLIYTPLLKWYIEKGLEITKVYGYIEAIRARPFETFTKEVSNRRREGDENEALAIIGEIFKNIGNSAFGGTAMDKLKHRMVSLVKGQEKAFKAVNKKNFYDLVEIEDRCNSEICYEITKTKLEIKQDRPIQVASAIFDLAKLRMLQFYYDCLDKYIDRKDFQLIEMDTDSLYMGVGDMKLNEEQVPRAVEYNKNMIIELEKKLLKEQDKKKIEELKEEIERRKIIKYEANESLTSEQIDLLDTAEIFETLVKPEKLEEFIKEQYDWFPRKCKEFKKYDKRTPGLFKVEFIGNAMIALASKSYYVQGEKKNKMASKGIQKSGNNKHTLLVFDKYYEALFLDKTLEATNRGFRMEKGVMKTYESIKIGLNPYYDKRGVMEDRITTYPLVNI